MTMCPSKYTVVSSQLRHTILMIVTVLSVRRFVNRSMIIVLEHNFDDSDGDYVPQHVHRGIITVTPHNSDDSDGAKCVPVCAS